MKNNDMNNKPFGILLIAAIFIMGGILTLVCYINKTLTEMWALLVGIIILVVGIIFVVYGILRIVALSNIKKLLNDPNAYETTAKFIKSKVSSYAVKSIGVGNIDITTSANVYKKIVYEYIDEVGVTHVVTSTSSYFPAQAKYLESLGNFKIKCKGKVSVITEPLQDPKSRYNIA